MADKCQASLLTLDLEPPTGAARLNCTQLTKASWTEWRSWIGLN